MCRCSAANRRGVPGGYPAVTRGERLKSALPCHWMLPLRMMSFVQGFGYRPVDDLSAVLMAGVRRPSGKEPAGGGVGGVLSMGICRGSVLGRGCTGRRNGRRTDDRGRDFVAAPAVGGVFWHD